MDLDKIFKHEKELHDYTVNKLLTFNDIDIYGTALNKGSIITFNFKDIHASDLAMILDQKHIAIRTGHHCAQPLMEYLNITSSARASFGVYNDINDVDFFVDSLLEAKKFLKIN